ncbi:MAG: hypothetical protein ABIA75_03875 [Candidatus Neomarinimicrobiota bacterium]
MIRRISALLLILFWAGCSTHPTVPVNRIKAGEKQSGYSFSLENVFPYYWYQIGISDQTSLGLRLGLPVYGTGVDWSRVLFEREDRWDLLNLSWSLNHNPNFDFTYYKIKSRPAATGKRTTYWIGFRGMYIPQGISGNTSTRIGLVLGTTFGRRLALELGYCHDFAAMPIGAVFSPSWDNESAANISRYGDKPPISPAGMPSEYSRLTGISVKFSLAIPGKSAAAGATGN